MKSDTCKKFYNLECFGYTLDCVNCKDYKEVKNVKKADKKLTRLIRKVVTGKELG